jgi:hypothetical protein
MLALPLPTYELVSESEDEWFPVNHSSPSRQPTTTATSASTPKTKTNLLGVSGCPPSYEAVTSEGSDSEIQNIAQQHVDLYKNEGTTRNKTRTSRSKRTSTSSIRNALNDNNSDSEDNEESDRNERRGKSKRKRSSNTSTNSVESADLPDLPVISSDPEGELEETDVTPTQHLPSENNNDVTNGRPSSPMFLTVPSQFDLGAVHHPGNSASPESNRKFNRSRSYTDLARHAIYNSIGRTAGASSPDIHRKRAKSVNRLSSHPVSHYNSPVNT